MYKESGDILFKKKGNSNSVAFTKKELKQMKGKVVTHNHPSNSCFSSEDIEILRTTKAAEMRAATKFGTYVINPPMKWVDEVANFEKIDKIYNDCLDNAISKAKDKAAREGKHLLYYLQEAEVEGTKEFCKSYGLKFRLEN